MAGPWQCVGFAILGDLMLGRHVSALIEREGVAALLSDVRAAAAGRPLVANLESPLCDQVPAVADGVLRFAAPTNLAENLREQGMAAVSLANNHVLDCGDDGLQATIIALDRAGIGHTGAGQSRLEAIAPAILKVGDVRIGILGFSYIQAATDTQPGVASLYDATVDEAIARVRPAVDFLVAMPHAGIELFQYPLPRDQRIYRRMVDLGVDLVVGSHPHCVQAAEVHAGRWIYYGIGDCLFDHYEDEVWRRFWSERGHPSRYGLSASRDLPRFSIMVTVDFTPQSATVTHIPLKLDPAPRRLTSDERLTWDAEFAGLAVGLQSDNAVLRQRCAIEEDLLASLKERGSR